MRTKLPASEGKKRLVKTKSRTGKILHPVAASPNRETSLARLRALAKVQHDHDKRLFAQWATEDATDDPKELKRRDEEHLELQRGLNANRKATGERLPYPELEEQDA